MQIGMLWLGEDWSRAILYFEKKFGKKPNQVEFNPSSSILGGKKVIHQEGLDLLSCKGILKGTILVGCKEDTDEIRLGEKR